MNEMFMKIVDAAREWLVDRPLSDPAERALGLAIMEAFPEDAQTKDDCTCGSSNECDECVDQKQLNNDLNNLRKSVQVDKDRHAAWVKHLVDNSCQGEYRE